VLAGQGTSVPAGEAVDPLGAQVRMEFTKQNGVLAPAAATCTFVPFGFPFGNTCLFTDPAAGFPSDEIFGVDLPPNSEFTLTLVKQPDSGQVLRLANSPASLTGHTTDVDSTPDPADPLVTGPLVLSAPGGYRTLGVSLGGDGARAGATFDLCTVVDTTCDPNAAPPVALPPGFPFGDPLLLEAAAAATSGMDPARVVSTTTNAQGMATFPGSHRPGAYTVVQTSAPAGQSFDPTPRVLTVGVATSLADRDTPVLLAVGDQPVDPPVTVPVDTPVTPAPAAAPVNEVAEQSLAAGEQQTISIGGFQPFEMVHGVLHSTPVDLGTVQADANGVATFTFTVPAGLETGTHSVTMEGLTSGIVGTATFTVTAAAESAGGLAYTGAEVVPLIALGGGLLVVGAGAVTVANRRRSA
jgi:hypothetical protein